MEFARQDDCLDKMVPSDLRQLIGAKERAEEQVLALAAQVDALKEALKPAVRLMRTTGQYSGWHEKADEAESLVNRELTTQQHLAEIRAEAVKDFIEFMYKSKDCQLCSESLDKANQYADQIRREVE